MKDPSVAIIILAAGRSGRMGLPKQLLPMKGKNLLQHTIDQAVASKAISVSVILGADAVYIQKRIREGNFKIVMNPHWTEGMSSSIRAGISALPGSIEAAIISLCDQPFLSAQIFDALIDTFASSHKSIVTCEFEGSVGPPVLFSKIHFPELSSLEGDAGARRVVLQHEGDVARVPFPLGSVDLDTAEDYRKFIQKDPGM
jgi:molybdenum cofactor cytidylyltransferase